MNRYLLAGIIAILLCTLSGCDSGDLMGSLGAGTQYASSVGMLMRAKGHTGFPTDPVSYGLYVRDLYDSIAQARSLTVGAAGLSDMGAMVARPTKVVPTDGRGLREAFGARGGGTP